MRVQDSFSLFVLLLPVFMILGCVINMFFFCLFMSFLLKKCGHYLNCKLPLNLDKKNARVWIGSNQLISKAMSGYLEERAQTINLLIMTPLPPPNLHMTSHLEQKCYLPALAGFHLTDGVAFAEHSDS